MSLQKLPSDRSAESLSTEKPYRLRRWEYTIQRWKERNPLELGGGLVAAIVSGVIAGGLGGALYAVIGFIASLIAIFLLPYLYAPRAFNKQQRTYIAALINEWPKRSKEIQWLSEQAGFWRFLESLCKSNPVGSLSAELQRIARASEKTVIEHLSDRARAHLKEELASTSVDLHRITAVLNSLDEAIAEQEKMPQLDLVSKGRLNP